jgi:hypothetical protein
MDVPEDAQIATCSSCFELLMNPTFFASTERQSWALKTNRYSFRSLNSKQENSLLYNFKSFLSILIQALNR